MVRRIVAASALAVGLVCAAAVPAWAHVTVAPESAPKGAKDQQITFRVPNEETSAATTKINMTLPSNPPLIGVLALPVPGWSVKVTTQHLSTPIQTDDGPVSDVVNDVTWTAANAASGVQPNNFGAFQVLVGALPSAGDQVVFKAVQTYSNGNVVSWVDPVTVGGPPADHPTPILALTAGTSTSGGATTTTIGTSGAATGAVKSAKDDASTAKTLGIVAIILAIIAIVIGGVALALRRRPASPVQSN